MTTPQEGTGMAEVAGLPDSLSELRASLPEPMQRALAFDETHFVTNPISADPFYTAPPSSASAPPGTLLNVQRTVDASKYCLPPSSAISRFTYQSASLSGTPVPVSALILWPFSPRRACASPSSPSSPSTYQTVAWAHGTSGLTPASAPSNIQNLWQHFLAPYQLALQGYIVVATDYAGLGISHTASGTPIPHQYLASAAQANDVMYSMVAARAAFPEQLGSNGPFVVAGHSEGGGAAWACAQRQVKLPVEGYLGAVALSPVTSVLRERPGMREMLVAAAVGFGGVEGFARDSKQEGGDGGDGSSFRREDLLGDEGLLRVEAIKRLGALLAPTFAFFSGVEGLVKEGWERNEVLKMFYAESAVVAEDKEGGGDGDGVAREWAMPLLVVHGDEDHILDFQQCVKAVAQAKDKCIGENAGMQFMKVKGVTHNASTTSVQWMWMDWIRDRFEGKSVEKYAEETIEAALEVSEYQREINWYVEKATEFYHTP